MNKQYTITLLLACLILFAGCESASQIQANQRIESMQMLKHLALGCHIYVGDNDGMLPATLADLKPYVNKPYNPEDYVLVASGKLSDIEQAANAVLIRQKAPLPDGHQAVAFADGQAAIVSTR